MVRKSPSAVRGGAPISVNPLPPTPRRLALERRGRLFRVLGTIFRWGTGTVALGLLLLVGGITLVLTQAAWASIRHFGPGFLTGGSWDPTHNMFGAVPFLAGTLLTSGLALLMAVPVALGVAIFLSELAPTALREPLAYVVDLLAAVPSVIYGLWGFIILAPVMEYQVEPTLQRITGGAVPFTGRPLGLDVLTASVVLAIMILPTISAISRESLQAVSRTQREAALSLGATRWEATRLAVLGPARSGIVGGILLGLGRAVGETIAVTLTIGNLDIVPASLLSPGQTIASLLANDFNDGNPTEFGPLIELGLVLLLVSLLINIVARLMIWRIRGESAEGDRPRRRWRGGFGHRHPGLSGPGVEPAPEGVPAWRAAAVARQPARRKLRRAKFWAVAGLCVLATVVAILPLASIVSTAVQKGGAAVVEPSFYTQEAPPACNPATQGSCPLGGIGPALQGTLILLALASAIAIPVGILAGVYLSEYGRNRFGQSVSFFTEVMTGIPSILIGTFVFIVFLSVDHNIAASAISGAVALSVLMIPLVARTTEEGLKSVPVGVREAALALGFPPHRVTLRVTLGCARNAIVTGALLASARAGGETAALLMTAQGFEFWSQGLGHPINALPLLIFNLAQTGYPNWVEDAWGATLVLLILMLALSFVTRVLFRRATAANSGA